MKKFIYLMAALVAVSSFSSCSKDYVGGKNLLIGDWEVYEYDTYDASGNLTDPDEGGWTYHFLKDGTFSADGSYSDKGTWSYDRKSRTLMLNDTEYIVLQLTSSEARLKEMDDDGSFWIEYLKKK